MDARHFRNALGRFTTGVTIVTCLDAAGQPVGLTASSFNALSLDPPLVLWSLRSASPSMPAFEAAPCFAVNVLSESQVELSRRFAARGLDRFADVAWALGEHGSPLISGCAAVFECTTLSHQIAGDHRLFIGSVRACSESPLPPLLFQSGHYRLLGEVL